jgi:hypothetical protein
MSMENVDLVWVDEECALLVTNGQDMPKEVIDVIRERVQSQIADDQEVTLSLLNPAQARSLAARLVRAADNVGA